jgi:hypothetical protein
MVNLKEKLEGIVRTVKASIRSDNSVDKSEAVSVYLDIDFSDCSIEDVLSFACSDRKIAWAAGGRKDIGRLTAGQHIKVRASSPGAKPQMSAMELLAEAAKAAGRTITEQFEFECRQRGM